jgi:predicted nucleic acid-binding Zn ribbon protein
VCGAAVPRAARACPECGADERTGWDEEKTRHDGLDLPDDAFEDDAGARRPDRPARFRINNTPLLWWLVGAVLLVALIVSLVSP